MLMICPKGCKKCPGHSKAHEKIDSCDRVFDQCPACIPYVEPVEQASSRSEDPLLTDGEIISIAIRGQYTKLRRLRG